MRIGHLPWANKEHTSKVIDLQNLFNEYWTSKAHKLTAPGQSRAPSARSNLIEKHRGHRRRKGQLPT